ncbi:DNA recombination protein RmuC [Campylobacter curvus]|uniref:DNA recombination protein RmuC n=1 Tax=Campylobacter curvus TaxID=200 RepID=UPI00146FED3D|nr:DNA recombination protein RmuC [Campylobacter curvus]
MNENQLLIAIIALGVILLGFIVFTIIISNKFSTANAMLRANEAKNAELESKLQAALLKEDELERTISELNQNLGQESGENRSNKEFLKNKEQIIMELKAANIQSQKSVEDLKGELESTRATLNEKQEQNAKLDENLKILTARLEAMGSQKSELEKSIEVQKSDLNAKEQNLRAQEENLAQLKQSLNLEFQNLANKIFEEKTSSFNKTSQTSLELLLKPLREQIAGFQNRVNEVHSEAVKSSVSLEEQIKQVLNIGLNMSKEAHSLTTALKGNNKIAGNWGEAQLERTLEFAGLIKGEHYFTQQNFKSESGDRAVPDFIIRLPDEKHIVIDSKVSLNAYEEAVSAGDEAKASAALSEHVRSVRRHIDELAKKDYASLDGLKSPDFVLMFMPVEPAYIEAMKFDTGLFNYGYERKVVLVSHTTLMPILRTIANLWRIERGNQEAQQIAARAGEIYNKVCGVADALARLGGTLNTVSNHYNQAVTSLVGKQGLLGKVERFKQLSSKAIQNEPEIAELNVKFEANRLEDLKPQED